MTRTLSIAFLAVILLASAFYYLRSGRAATPSGERVETTLPLVTVATAKLETPADQVTLAGTVQAGSQAAVGAKVPARITAILVREGERVVAGQPLARLDLGDLDAQIAAAEAGLRGAQALARKAEDGRLARRSELDAQVAQAEASLALARSKLTQAELGQKLTRSAAVSDRERARSGVAMAKAALEQAEIGLAQAQDAYARLKRLHEKGGVAKVDLDGAEAQLRLARAQRETAAAGLEQARAAEQPAVDSVPLRDEVSLADLEAARAGVKLAEEGLRTARAARSQALRIAERDVEAARAGVEQARAGVAQARGAIGGAVVTAPLSGIVANLTAKAGEYAQPGYALMNVVQDGNSHILAPASSRVAELLRPGMQATVLTAGGAEAARAGRLTSVSPIAGSDGRSFQVRVAYDQRPKPLPNGASVEVVLSIGGLAPSVVIPTEAIRYRGNETYVFRLADGSVRSQPVIAGRSTGGKTYVMRGLAAGDRVVVTGPSDLRDGMPVRAGEP
jgi:RND family efflux transporter MFP subunit